MKLYLIRHAESANNAIYAQTGSYRGRSPDPEITELGHKQAALLGPHLANPTAEPRQNPFEQNPDHSFGITHLYCSLMTRSILTAEYIAKACNLPLQAHADIFEKGGIYEADENFVRTGLPGRDRDYFEQRFPDLRLPEGFNDAGWYNRPHETPQMFLERVPKAISDIRQRHENSDDVVALVVHGDFIDQVINELMGVRRPGPNYSWNWASNNTSISRIDFENGSHIVIYFNRIDHLPAELVSW